MLHVLLIPLDAKLQLAYLFALLIRHLLPHLQLFEFSSESIVLNLQHQYDLDQLAAVNLLQLLFRVSRQVRHLALRILQLLLRLVDVK